MDTEKKVIDCGVELTISKAADLHHQLQTATHESLLVELKAGAVEKVDSAGLQVIVSAFKEIEKTSGKISWDAPSDVLRQAANTLGLSPFVGLDL